MTLLSDRLDDSTRMRGAVQRSLMLRIKDYIGRRFRDPALGPALRTFGTSIGGYKAGWFRLRDGERALLYVTDPTRVAYVPTTNGYAVLVSVADPAAFLTSLRKAIQPGM